MTTMADCMQQPPAAFGLRQSLCVQGTHACNNVKYSGYASMPFLGFPHFTLCRLSLRSCYMMVTCIHARINT